MTTAPQSSAAGPRPGLVTLLALGAGLSVAGLYYNQPMLEVLAREFEAPPGRIGFVATATQLGYAAGIVLFAPLGDKLDRKRVILVKSVLLAVALALAGVASGVLSMAAASIAVGIFATTAQDLVPAAAQIAVPERRGQTVGTVMTGLLLGILLSRVVAGAVTEAFSWRVVYFGAAGTVALFAVVSAWLLPSFPPTVSASYRALLASIGTLVRRQASLRRASLRQALLSAAFSGFWTTLALGLAAPPLELGSAVAGTFGLAGAAGALAAPVAGRLADKRGPASVVRFGAALTALSFAGMALLPHSIPALVAGTVLFDLGVQSCLIAHQTIVYAEDPSARSRLNAVLVSSMFLGMSAGAFAASRLFARFGFVAVCAMGAGLAACALAVPFVKKP